MNVTSYIIDNSNTNTNNNDKYNNIINYIVLSDSCVDILSSNIDPDGPLPYNMIYGKGESNSVIDNISKNHNQLNQTDNTKELITNTTTSECVGDKSICSSKRMINLMSTFSNKKGPDINIVKEVANKLHCDSESCILINPEFTKYVEKETGSTNIIKYELNKNFKTRGPRNSTNLLSNYNIDETLLRWSREFKDFFPCPFSMIDFKITNNAFNKINVSDVIIGKVTLNDPIDGPHHGPFSTYACVLNTDTSLGQGKHWVCVFVDCRNKRGIWTLEYFNSSGNPPNSDVNEWLEMQRNNLLKIYNNVETIAVTNIVHQQSNTECGMYVLYYIRSRLDNVSYKHFLNHKIKDQDVTTFRKHVFRKY